MEVRRLDRGGATSGVRFGPKVGQIWAPNGTYPGLFRSDLSKC